MRPGWHVSLLVLVAMGVLSSGWCLRGEFHWDDRVVILRHPAIRAPERWLGLFRPEEWHRAHTELPSPYRPVREISLGLLMQLGGGRPLPFHVASLAIHLGNVLLIWMVALQLTGRGDVALLAGALFAAHPAHVESVCWAKNLGELLALFFGLLSWLSFHRAVRPMEGAKDGMRHWLLIASVCAYAMALLSKESAGVMPPLLIGGAWLLFAGRERRRAILASVPFWVVSAVYAVVQLQVLSLGGRRFMGAGGMSFGGRVTLVTGTALEYLSILAMPVMMNPWRAFEMSVRHTTAIFGMALIIGMFIFSFRRSRVEAFGWLWTLLAMGPAVNVMVNEVRPIAEQRLYFPSVGFCLWLGLVALSSGDGKGAAEGIWGKRWRWMLGAAILCAWAALSVESCETWRSNHALWRRVTRLRPQLPEAHHNLATAYTNEELVLVEYEHAMRLNPRHVETLYNLGTLHLRRGMLDLAERELRAALAVDPAHAPSLNNLGRLHERQGQWEKALEAYEAAIRAKPDYAPAYHNAGTLYENMKRLSEAERAYRRAVELDAGHVYALTNLGNLLMQRGAVTEAREMYMKALRSTPTLWQAHAGLGAALMAEGRPREAIIAYFDALRFAPSGPPYRNLLRVRLASAYRAAGMRQEAVRELVEILRDEPDNAEARRLLVELQSNR